MKVGVIGTGNMGENHIRTYKSLSDSCRLAGIYDTNEKRNRQMAENYNVPPFYSLEELLEEVDAVSITVPTPFHYDVGLRCIEHKVHMLMEKPITSTVQEAKTLVKKAGEQDLILQVGHIELFNPVIQTLKKEIQNQNVIALDTHRLSPYQSKFKDIDVVHDLMIHDLYIINELMEDELKEFYTLGQLIETSPKHAIVIAEFKQGVVAQVTASLQSNKMIRTVQVLTEKAYFTADLLRNEINITRTDKPKTKDFPSTVTRTIQIPPFYQPLMFQLKEFISCIKNNTEPLVSGTDGIKSLTISSEISEAIKKQKGNRNS
ncbi:Gfo/Idh/MocA family protein [Salibacterium qingdaonense]|uniref:Predicted dehydrogenase n=1 Tax=Salibacterium qingdaonense TaxID=266892 RepID=A0A1I4MEU9_9BACI|nr:Gfo/Idh/MocA family oxidoreductase [Salibacterium qingdaonense]SFM01487.1 Predicted dehydrogenase [Salibacterium qingdaonense]